MLAPSDDDPFASAPTASLRTASVHEEAMNDFETASRVRRFFTRIEAAYANALAAPDT